MTPLLLTETPNTVAVLVASVALGLRLMMPVLLSHSVAGLEVGACVGTMICGPMNFCFARSTPPSRRMLLSLR